MSTIRWMVGAVAVSFLAAGCAAEAGETGAVNEPQATATEELSYTSIVGDYASNEGPIFAIDFTSKKAQTLGGGLKGHAFTATIDNGVRCIKAPCPSTSAVSGVYAVSGKTLTLASYDKPAAFFGAILGDYKIVHGKDGLQIDKKDGTISEALHVVHGVACGDTVCSGGDVCCNPLMSLCTKPGDVCVQ